MTGLDVALLLAALGFAGAWLYAVACRLDAEAHMTRLARLLRQAHEGPVSERVCAALADEAARRWWE